LAAGGETVVVLVELDRKIEGDLVPDAAKHEPCVKPTGLFGPLEVSNRRRDAHGQALVDGPDGLFSAPTISTGGDHGESFPGRNFTEAGGEPRNREIHNGLEKFTFGEWLFQRPEMLDEEVDDPSVLGKYILEDGVLRLGGELERALAGTSDLHVAKDYSIGHWGFVQRLPGGLLGQMSGQN